MSRRFSLFEFLVVVAIIAILSAMTMRAVNALRDHWVRGASAPRTMEKDSVAKANGESIDLLIQANAVEARIREADRKRVEALERRVEILEARLAGDAAVRSDR